MAKMKAEAAKQPQITVDYESLITNHSKWAAGEASDASRAGERRQQIGQFAEAKGVENKALSQIRAGLKIKNEGKRMDWLRSMEVMLPLAAQVIRGNSTMEMNLDPEEGPEPVDFSDEEPVAAE